MDKSERKIGLFGAVSLSVGLVIGASMFVLIPSVVSMTGTGAVLAYILAGIPIAFGCFSALQIAGTFPTTGGSYVMSTVYGSPSASFAISLTQTGAIWATLCFQAYAAAAYIQLYLPSISAQLIALVIIVAFGILNLIGVDIVSWIQTAMVVFLVALTAIFITGGISISDAANYTPIMPNGFSLFTMAIGIAVFSWLGLSTISSYAGEIKKPSKTIPKAIVIALVILSVAYALVAIVFSGAVPMSEIGAAGATVASDVVAQFGGTALVHIFNVAIIFAILTTVNACYMIASREMVAWAEQKTGPAAFGKLNPTTKVPTINVLITIVFTIIFAFFAMSLQEYALVMVFPVILYQIIQAYACLHMTKVDPERYEKSTIKLNKGILTLSLVGNIILGVLIMYFTYTASANSAYIAAILLILGFIWYFARSAYLKSKGISLKENVKQINEAVQKQIDNQ
jgi:APA family basic amino acid/polyamine antiporter